MRILAFASSRSSWVNQNDPVRGKHPRRFIFLAICNAEQRDASFRNDKAYYYNPRCTILDTEAYRLVLRTH